MVGAATAPTAQCVRLVAALTCAMAKECGQHIPHRGSKRPSACTKQLFQHIQRSYAPKLPVPLPALPMVPSLLYTAALAAVHALLRACSNGKGPAQATGVGFCAELATWPRGHSVATANAQFSAQSTECRV